MVGGKINHGGKLEEDVMMWEMKQPNVDKLEMSRRY